MAARLGLFANVQVVAEYAVAHALQRGMRTIYTSPIKAGMLEVGCMIGSA